MSGPQSRLSPAPRRGDWRQFARLARFMLPYRARIAGALLALMTAAACVLALGQGLKHVVDNGFGSGDPRLLDEALGAMIAVAAVLVFVGARSDSKPSPPGSHDGRREGTSPASSTSHARS